MPASHRVAAVKAPEELKIPNWEQEVAEVAMKYLNAFATYKLQCGKISAGVTVAGLLRNLNDSTGIQEM